LANTVSARKRARQSEKRRTQNTRDRSRLRTQIKKVVNAIASGDKDKAKAAYTEATPVIDRMANKGIIHANKAARHKSRLNDAIHSLSQPPAT
jgi:small subunit ribosomal protein S20